MARSAATAQEIAFGSVVSKALKSARERAGFSSNELAQRSGVTVDAIRRIEGGYVNSPGLYLVGRIAKALKLSIDAVADEALESSEP